MAVVTTYQGSGSGTSSGLRCDMIHMNLQDRNEYKIGDDWSVHEIIVVMCAKCKKDTIEVMTYQDMTLYYHEAGARGKIRSCTVHRGTGKISNRLVPYIEQFGTMF
jgi:hypothetical protein